MKFNLGDSVEWTSSAAGGTKTKRGIIVHILRSGTRWLDIEPRLREKHSAGSAYGGGYKRDHESYAVLVQPPASIKTGKRPKPVLYWPVVLKLRKVEENE